MATLQDLNVIINANTAGFQTNMANVTQILGSVGNLAKSAGSSLSQYVTLPLTLLGGAAIQTFGELQALDKGFKAIYKGAGDVNVELAKTKELAKLPGLGLAEAVQGSVRLQAVGVSAEQARKSLLAFGNAIAITGGGKAELGRVTTQLAQLAAKGKVLTGDLRPIIEAAPAVAEALQKLYGTIDAQDISTKLAKDGKNSKDFIADITTELGKLPSVSGGVKNALENASDSITKSLGKVGEVLNKTFNVEGKLARFGDFIEGLSDKFSGLDPATQKLILTFAGVAAAAGPVLVAVGSIAAAAPILGAAFTALTGPVGLAVAAIAAGAFLVIKNWDSIVAYFQGPEGQVFRQVADNISESFDLIKQAFSTLSTDSLGDLISIGDILTTVATEIGTGVARITDSINGLVRTVVGLLNGDWARAWDGAKQAVAGLASPLAALFGLDYEGFRQKLGVLGDKPNEGVSVLTNQFVALNAGLQGFIPLVAGATKGLDTVADSTGKAVGPTKDMLEALQKLQDALRVNGQLSTSLGSDYDFIGERQKILESNLKNLVEAGYTPASAAVRKYAEELKLLNAIQAGAEGKPMSFKSSDVQTIPNAAPAELDFDGTYAAKAQQAAAQYVAAMQSLTPAQRAAIESQTQFNTEMGELVDSISLRFGAIADAAGNAFGNFVTGAATASQALGQALGGVVGVLADFMKDYGKKLILLGAGAIALGNVGQGLAQIAAGGAIVAAAGVAGAVGSSLGRAASGNNSPGRINSYTPPNQASASQSREKIGIEITFKEPNWRLEGTALRSVMQVDSWRLAGR